MHRHYGAFVPFLQLWHRDTSWPEFFPSREVHHRYSDKDSEITIPLTRYKERFELRDDD